MLVGLEQVLIAMANSGLMGLVLLARFCVFALIQQEEASTFRFLQLLEQVCREIVIFSTPKRVFPRFAYVSARASESSSAKDIFKHSPQ